MAKALVGYAFKVISGKVGNTVFMRGKDGQSIRELVIPTNPQTPAQVAARTRLTTASRLFKNFNAAQELAWDTYAQTVSDTNDVTGKHIHLSGISAFIALSTKFLQINPGGTVPLTPPATAYVGDNVTVSATASTGKVTFTASAANSLGTKTELLLQKLPSRNRNPQKKGYRSKAFVAFAGGSLSFDVVVPPGYYAAAYRFVNISTGQDTALVPIGIQQVTLTLESGNSKKKAA